MTRKVILSAAILVLLSLAFVPALEASPQTPQFIFQDICGNGVGWSIPGMGQPGCNVVDCCAMYQTAHVHDLGQIFKPVKIVIFYTPGLYAGCTDTMTVSYSTDGQTWKTLTTVPVTTAASGGGYETYTMTLKPKRVQLRYVMISIPNCYNDLSEAIVIF